MPETVINTEECISQFTSRMSGPWLPRPAAVPTCAEASAVKPLGETQPLPSKSLYSEGVTLDKERDV